MGIRLVKFLGGTYPVSESVKILLDELNKAGIDEAAREELFLNRFSMSEKMPSLYEELENNPDFKFEDIKKYSLQMSKKILIRLDQAPDKKSVLTQAYVFCPFLLEVYKASVRYGLLDWDTYKTAEYFGYAESVLDEISSFLSAHPEDKELADRLVPVFAEAKGLSEEAVWASFGKSGRADEPKILAENPKKSRRKEAAEEKKRAKAEAAARKKAEAEEKKRAKEEASARKKAEAEEKKSVKVETEVQDQAEDKENIPTAEDILEDLAFLEKKIKPEENEDSENPEEKEASEKNPESVKKQKSGKNGRLLLAGLVILGAVLIFWFINRTPSEEEPVDAAAAYVIEEAPVEEAPVEEAPVEEEPVEEEPVEEEPVEEEPVEEEPVEEVVEEQAEPVKSGQEIADEKIASLHESILSELDGKNVYEYNDKTHLYGFEKTVKNTTDLVLENVVLEVSLGTDVNTFTREVWNPDEEWTLIVNASEETLVDDFVMEAKITQYTCQGLTEGGTNP